MKAQRALVERVKAAIGGFAKCETPFPPAPSQETALRPQARVRYSCVTVSHWFRQLGLAPTAQHVERWARHAREGRGRARATGQRG